MGIHAITTPDKRLELQLRFYGISNDSPKLLQRTTDSTHYDISIEYLGKAVAYYKILPQAPSHKPSTTP